METKEKKIRVPLSGYFGDLADGHRRKRPKKKVKKEKVKKPELKPQESQNPDDKKLQEQKFKDDLAKLTVDDLEYFLIWSSSGSLLSALSISIIGCRPSKPLPGIVKGYKALELAHECGFMQDAGTFKQAEKFVENEKEKRKRTRQALEEKKLSEQIPPQALGEGTGDEDRQKLITQIETAELYTPASSYTGSRRFFKRCEFGIRLLFRKVYLFGLKIKSCLSRKKDSSDKAAEAVSPPGKGGKTLTDTATVLLGRLQGGGESVQEVRKKWSDYVWDRGCRVSGMFGQEGQLDDSGIEETRTLYGRQSPK